MITTRSLALESYSLLEQLQSFKANPKVFMSDQKNIQKYLQNYRIIAQDSITGLPLEIEFQSEEALSQVFTHFSQEIINSREFVDIKNSFNEATREQTRPGRAAINQSNDDPAYLVDNLVFTKLEDMEKHGLRNATLHKTPWSGSYWPIYAGGLAMRYLDSQFPRSMDWHTNNSFILKTISNYTDINSSSVDFLSPAEKYDLLVGDDNMTLTRSTLNDGKAYYERYGKVEPWMGICHGWAAAAIMEDRPSHAIKVTAVKGFKITFYPADIKALAALLWAKSAPRSKFVGQRCQIRNPPTDDNGRITDQTCFDTNPGTWHLAVINQIGVNKRSFILDATYDYEVWNQPAYAYEYSYFNPQTGQETKNVKDAIVSKTEFRDDVFKKWRNDPRTSSFVGIRMKFTYISETEPAAIKKDNKSNDRLISVNYLYDLELDAQGNIIGGEWYHQQHPDFMWKHCKIDRRSMARQYPSTATGIMEASPK